jgi:HD-GYP domain-containing protein (c-di-GMP phosphodiesterase class II)
MMATRREAGRWTGRPWIARGIRIAVHVVPFAASVVVAWRLSSLLPTVTTVPSAIVRWLLIAAVSTLVMIAVDRVTRRALPLAALLSLTLAFPDEAPSRFRLAIRTGTTLQLRKTIADARAGRIGSTPAAAAEQLLELVGALSLHDRLTRGHSDRVRGYAQVIGEELGLDATELDRLRWAAMLHDVGELLVSADVLNKPGPLTPAEQETVRRHPEFGRELVAPLADWLGDSARAVWEHHERWDGAGYPNRLSGPDISLAARIVAVADAFDAMTSSQSYQQPVSATAARAELARCAGSQFDPAVVRAFLNVSAGRLRMVMGPLSWLTQLSLVPQSLVTAGTSGTSAVTAVTAVVGLGAGALGIGLGEDGVIAAAERSTGGVVRVDDAVGRPFVSDAGPGDTGPPEAGAPAAPVTPVPTAPVSAAPSTLPASTVATSATTTPASAPDGTKPPSPDPKNTGETKDTKDTEHTEPAATDPATSPPTAEPTTTAPPPPAAATTAAPVTTVAPTTTSVPATTSTTSTTSSTSTTTTTTSTTSTTIAPAADPQVFLTSPGSGDTNWQEVLPLVPGVPDALEVANYDKDRNGDPGLTLLRATEWDHQHFRWEVGERLRLQGTPRVTLYAVAKHRDLGEFLLDVQLCACRDGACEELGWARAGGVTPTEGWAELNFELDPIDVVLDPGDSLELVVTVPAASPRHVWLAYDSVGTPSRIWVD